MAVGLCLALALLALPTAASAQPKQCRSYSSALTTCEIDLARYKPILMPVVRGSVAMGQTLSLTLVAPIGDVSEFATQIGDWDIADLSGGGFLITLTPPAIGTYRLAYRVVVGEQLYEYPVEVAVVP